MRGFPALVVERPVDGADDHGPPEVSIRVLATETEQHAATRQALRVLLMRAVRSPATGLVDDLDNRAKLALGMAPHRTSAALLEDTYAAAVDAIVAEAGGVVWERSAFDQLVDAVRREGESRTRRVIDLLVTILPAAHDVLRRLSGRAELALLPALSDLKGQWERLIYDGFVTDAGVEALRHYPRYLAAMATRLDKLQLDPRRDAVLMGSVAPVQAAYLDRLSTVPSGLPVSDRLREVRWMIEELRVGTWAQELKTARPVSVQRVEKALREL